VKHIKIVCKQPAEREVWSRVQAAAIGSLSVHAMNPRVDPAQVVTVASSYADVAVKEYRERVKPASRDAYGPVDPCTCGESSCPVHCGGPR
jgi:hypothetical protein